MYPLREKCPNTELFLVHIQSEYRKIRTETTPYLDTFYAANLGTPFIPVVFENFSQMISNITSSKVYLQPSRTSMMGLKKIVVGF